MVGTKEGDLGVLPPLCLKEPNLVSNSLLAYPIKVFFKQESRKRVFKGMRSENIIVDRVA